MPTRRAFARSVLMLLLALPVLPAAPRAADGAANPAAFTPIFDGGNLDAFEADGEARKHWAVEDGAIRYDGKHQHLWTRKSYRDFILRIDWRLPDPGPRRTVPVILPSGDQAVDENGKPKEVEIQYGGDSGIYLRGSSKSQVNIWNWPIGSGEVYGYRTDRSMPPEVRAGVTPKQRADRPLGEWNSFVIQMQGDRLSVDLNGITVISSARLPGVAREGKIALQHHGDRVEFRNIAIRELPADLVPLFNGRNLEGWEAIGAAPDTWSVRDGMLVTTGNPRGYLRTIASHSGYVLEGEWRFAGKGGQTGLLLHLQEPDRVWPKSIEIQLDHGVIGNFIPIGGVRHEGGKRSKDVEVPVGRWNHFAAVCDGDRITCFMNGEQVSEATRCEPTAGTIGFQSEGVEVHFRNIWLRPLKN